MKIQSLLIILLVNFAIGDAVAQRVKPSEFEAKATLINNNQAGATIRIVGYGVNEAKAREDAEYRAARSIIFIGLSQGGKLSAMVPSSKENTEFFKNFMETGQYRNYYSAVESAGTLDKVKGQKYKQMAFDITVNIKSLERALRQAGEIKEMGF